MLFGWQCPVHFISAYAGSFYWSEDGSSWRIVDEFSDHKLTAMAYANGVLIAADEAGQTWHSTDGTSWKEGGTVSDPKAAAANEGSTFVIVGSGIWHSTDGESWMPVTDVLLPGTIWDVSYGNGVFIAAAGGGEGSATI